MARRASTCAASALLWADTLASSPTTSYGLALPLRERRDRVLVGDLPGITSGQLDGDPPHLSDPVPVVVLAEPVERAHDAFGGYFHLVEITLHQLVRR
jgi:hypothetical protein